MDATTAAAVTRPSGPPDNAFTLLNLEWAALRTDPEINAIAASWAAEEPALSGLSTLTLIEQAKAGPVDARVDALLAALVRRAAANGADAAVAARVALQLMLPKTARIARAHAWLLPDAGERDQMAVCCMYTAIRTHPARITHHVPPYLAWRAHHAMRREVAAQIREHPIGTAADVPASAVDANPSEELAHLLAWAVAEKVITSGEAELLAARYGTDTPGRTGSWKTVGDLRPLSASTGMSEATLRKRCSRARQRLAAAAAAYLAATGACA